MSNQRGYRRGAQNRVAITGGWREPRGRGRQHNAGNQRQGPPPRQMELLASVSRSSGLEKDGDTLKNPKVQQEYRGFIQEKAGRIFFDICKPSDIITEVEKNHRIEAQENVLILLRKLREGISSSNRRDHFAIEVYETSLFLSSIFASPRHASAIIPYLVPELYLSCPSPHPNVMPAILVSLAHHLLVSYPSQGPFQQQLDSIPTSVFPKTSVARLWIASLSASVRTRDYAKFEKLSRQTSILHALGLPENSLPQSGSGQKSDLGLLAICASIDALRHRTRETTWSVMRSAYRELACQSESQTRSWLERSLCLQSNLSSQSTMALDDWLQQQSELGTVRPKEGVEGRWIVCKIRM
ncbi:hypothetical protein AMATHDRAFT_146437 [Amanita thiersii Skay4041]|uniref:Uncharacterized protein n=1 Tax=Amanita thiersii Skay4041 TaxID=703135 RepID=A0A2A9NNU8_9AGAR|nr:hypothetical protein AMATHDRAFT_146437 [Amanita thiersii Skay4041]